VTSLRPYGPFAAIAAAALLMLAGCGGGGAKPSAADVSQIAAQVNDGEISIHQVQQVLQRQPALVAAQPQAAARRVLESLVEQELAAQAARQQGLDRDPAVIQALQVAQREVLARAWQDRLAAQASGIASDDVDRYYDSHPALFAQRRLYMLQEAVVAVPADRIDAVRSLAAGAKGAAGVIDGLLDAGLRAQSRQFVQGAEDLPFGLLDRMAALSAGESLVLPEDGGLRILTVLQAQAAPVDRKLAAGAITGFLASERRRQAVEAGMKPLREAGRVRYVGNFAAVASEPAATAP
jgi:EpsD family peptidyl-prolyl cis-trans isomerase